MALALCLPMANCMEAGAPTRPLPLSQPCVFACLTCRVGGCKPPSTGLATSCPADLKVQLAYPSPLASPTPAVQARVPYTSPPHNTAPPSQELTQTATIRNAVNLKKNTLQGSQGVLWCIGDATLSAYMKAPWS
jgi:hypothetical protein